jgi:aspartate aminotransferase
MGPGTHPKLHMMARKSLIMVSKRVSLIRPSAIREAFEAAGKDAVNLGLGEPDFDPPEEARRGIKEAVDRGHNHYGPVKGIDELRVAVAAANEARYSVPLTSKNVMITGSGTEALSVIFQTLFEPGDDVLVPDPGFVLYGPDTILAGARPLPYFLTESNHFEPDVDNITAQLTDRTKAILVNSPSNPTGGVATKEQVRALIDLARDHDLWLISDEVYEDYVYQGEHHSYCGATEKTIIVNSFSKSMAVTGWRIGYLLAPETILDKLAMMQYYTIACPATPPQYGVLAALPHMDAFRRSIVDEFDRRRHLMVKSLNAIPGFFCDPPKGAFYAFPRFDFDVSSRELSRHLVKAGVISVPGCAFGHLGERHMRFSYAASSENIRNGMDLVKEAVADLPQTAGKGELTGHEGPC